MRASPLVLIALAGCAQILGSEDPTGSTAQGDAPRGADAPLGDGRNGDGPAPACATAPGSAAA